jgi:MYXO-CTERM domain-containing protein
VACLVTPVTASAYGPVVETTVGNIIVSEPNLAGCIEIADPAGLACATKLQDRTDCDEAACNTVCPVTDDPSFQLWETCETNADNAAGSCEAYYDATSCVDSEMPDGGAAEACFPTVANPGFEDGYNAIAPVFCLDLTAGADGGGASDGGGTVDGGSTSDASAGSDASGGSDGGAVDGGIASSDGGPVTTPVDAGGGSDGGGGSSPAKSSSGCSCRTAPASEGASALLALAGVVLLARARRRKR